MLISFYLFNLSSSQIHTLESKQLKLTHEDARKCADVSFLKMQYKIDTNDVICI